MPEAPITQLLKDFEGGEAEAFDRLVAAIYPALLRMARAQLRGQRSDHTLNTHDLVHEAYLRLVRYDEVDWKGRGHFFGAAAQTMRRILVDYARARSANKRKGERVTLTGAGLSSNDSLERLIEIDDALTRMEEVQPRWVRVVEARYFGGLTIEETAEALGISHGTVSNDWRMARAWLKSELSS